MLFSELVEVRRLLEAEGALGGAGAAPWQAGLEVIRPLPSVLGAEYRAKVLHARMQRARPFRAAPLVGVEWIAEVVVVLVGLAGELGRVAEVAVHRPEAPGPVGVEVELRLAGGDQLSERAPDATRSAESIQRKSRGHVEAAHPWHRADERTGIGSHRIGMADELDDAGVVHGGKPPGRAGEQRLEARLVGRK